MYNVSEIVALDEALDFFSQFDALLGHMTDVFVVLVELPRVLFTSRCLDGMMGLRKIVVLLDLIEDMRLGGIKDNEVVFKSLFVVTLVSPLLVSVALQWAPSLLGLLTFMINRFLDLLRIPIFEDLLIFFLGYMFVNMLETIVKRYGLALFDRKHQVHVSDSTPEYNQNDIEWVDVSLKSGFAESSQKFEYFVMLLLKAKKGGNIHFDVLVYQELLYYR